MKELLEKYENNIYFVIMQTWFTEHYNLAFDKFGQETNYSDLIEPLHIHIKYDNGQFNYSITSAPPPQRRTRRRRSPRSLRPRRIKCTCARRTLDRS